MDGLGQGWFTDLAEMVGRWARGRRTVFLVWVVRTLSTNLTDTVMTRREHTLVISGPYRWIRRPFYLAFGPIILSDFLATANWFLAPTGGLAFTLILVCTTKREENLIQRFGDDYRRYQDRTGQLFPVSKASLDVVHPAASAS